MIVVHDDMDELSVQAHYHQMKHLFKHSLSTLLSKRVTILAAVKCLACLLGDGKENPKINISTPVKVPQLISDSGLP
jgi:hypothetical protein